MEERRMANLQRKRSQEDRLLQKKKEEEDFQNAIKLRQERELKRAHSMKEVRENEQQLVSMNLKNVLHLLIDKVCEMFAKVGAFKSSQLNFEQILLQLDRDSGVVICKSTPLIIAGDYSRTSTYLTVSLFFSAKKIKRLLHKEENRRKNK